MQLVRAIYRACKLEGAEPPHDNVSLKVYYEGQLDEGSDAFNTGLVPPVSRDAPMPVVVILPGINVGPESYSWLAERIAAHGMVAVTASHIAEEMPGFISLTPGLDIAALTPAEYGKRPSATAVGAVLNMLDELNSDSVLAGQLATDKVVLAGHSAGGSVVLFNANQEWFPAVCGAVAYGAHSAASTVLGYDENTVLPLPDSVPVLLMAGSQDGVIAGSGHRYGDSEGDPLQRVQATFDEGIRSTRDDSYLVVIEGANHFSFAWPHDSTTGRGFLDWDETADGGEIRECIATTLLAFADAVTGRAENMKDISNNPLVASVRRR